jgi:hypothetical protein
VCYLCVLFMSVIYVCYLCVLFMSVIYVCYLCVLFMCVIYVCYLCVLFICRRYPDLVEMAMTYHGGVPQMARKWARVVRKKANNERAVQVRYIKKVWLSKNSPHCLVTNCLEGDHTQDTQMVVVPALVASGLSTTEDVRQCIKSNGMYLNSVLFNLFCGGLESGMLRLTMNVPFTPIRDLITVAHEAHFRMELYYALERQRYRHSVTHAWALERRTIWLEFCELVLQDRQANEITASQARLATLNQPDDASDASSDVDDVGLVPANYF